MRKRPETLPSSVAWTSHALPSPSSRTSLVPPPVHSAAAGATATAARASASASGRIIGSVRVGGLGFGGFALLEADADFAYEVEAAERLRDVVVGTQREALL